jgi:hypothetical protein
MITEEIAHDSSVEETEAGHQNSQNANAEENHLQTVGVILAPVKKLALDQSPAPTPNRIIAYGAIAATLGIVAGLVFASFAGGSTARNVPSNPGSANSNAAGLAELVKPAVAAPGESKPSPADARTPPVELAAAKTPSALRTGYASHRKAKKKEPEGPPTFAIEGDDELVGYDPSKGVIQTSARKTFLVSATTASGTSAWQDGPANIHYKCDLNSRCTLTRSGATVLYAQLKK